MAIRVGTGDPHQSVPRAQGAQSKPAAGSAKAELPDTGQGVMRLGWNDPSPSLHPRGESLERLSFVDQPIADWQRITNQGFATETEQTEHFYINGIRTDQASAQGDADALTKILQRGYLSELERARGELPKRGSADDAELQRALAGIKYELIYNPSALEKHGDKVGTLIDGAEAIRNLTGIQTQIAAQTAERFLAVIKQGRKLSVVAHSQGGAITADALRRVAARLRETHSPAEVKAIFAAQVKVRTMGGFAPGNSFPAGVLVETINNTNDFVPKYGADIYKYRHSLPLILSLPIARDVALLKVLAGPGTAAWLKITGEPGVLANHATRSNNTSLGYINQIDSATAWRLRLPGDK